jgi:hypothetical protein
MSVKTIAVVRAGVGATLDSHLDVLMEVGGSELRGCFGNGLLFVFAQLAAQFAIPGEKRSFTCPGIL